MITIRIDLRSLLRWLYLIVLASCGTVVLGTWFANSLIGPVPAVVLGVSCIVSAIVAAFRIGRRRGQEETEAKYHGPDVEIVYHKPMYG